MERHFKSSLVAAAATALVLPATGWAAGWTQEAGKARIIVTGIYSHSAKSYDDDGEAAPAPDYDKTEVYVQGEYGLTDEVTLILAPSFRRVVIEGANDDSTGLGFTEVGARYRFAGSGRFVASLQATARIPGQRRRDVAAQIGATDPEYDIRTQLGQSFRLFGRESFAIAQGGYRLRAGDPPNEFHANLTLGTNVSERLMLMASSYNTWSDGAGRNIFRSYRYSSVFSGAVIKVSERFSLQAGGTMTISGRNALRERGAFLGAWISL